MKSGVNSHHNVKETLHFDIAKIMSHACFFTCIDVLLNTKKYSHYITLNHTWWNINTLLSRWITNIIRYSSRCIWGNLSQTCSRTCIPKFEFMSKPPQNNRLFRHSSDEIRLRHRKLHTETQQDQLRLQQYRLPTTHKIHPFSAPNILTAGL